MSIWNYRLVRTPTPKAAGGKHLIRLTEVYYNDKGKPSSWISDDVGIMGWDVDEAREVYDMMGEAFRSSVLEVDEDGNFVKDKK